MKDIGKSLALLEEFFAATSKEQIDSIVEAVDRTSGKDVSLEEYFSSLRAALSIEPVQTADYCLSEIEYVQSGMERPSILLVCEPAQMFYGKKKTIPYMVDSPSYGFAA